MSSSMVPTTTMRDESQEFIHVVNTAMEELMVCHGYSRERATKALLQVVSRSVTPSTISVTEEQVFALMQRYQLGMEQAARALIVSKTLEHIMAGKGISSTNAVNQLLHHIRKAKLVSTDPYDSSSSSDESDTGGVTFDLPVQLSVRSNIKSPTGTKQPSSSLVSGQKRRKILETPTSSRKNNKASSSTSTTKVNIKNNNTKLSVQVVEHSQQQQQRDRADSAADEVVAKLNNNTNEGASANKIGTTNTKSSSTVVVGRGKRTRNGISAAGEESDSDMIMTGTTTTNKRSRA